MESAEVMPFGTAEAIMRDQDDTLRGSPTTSLSSLPFPTTSSQLSEAEEDSNKTLPDQDTSKSSLEESQTPVSELPSPSQFPTDIPFCKHQTSKLCPHDVFC